MKKPLALALTSALTFVLIAALAVVGSARGIRRCRTAAVQPPISGIDGENADKTVRPQDDLFRAVNGAWLAKAEIPADRYEYGVFPMLADRCENDLRGIVEGCANAANDANDASGSERRKIGDMYASYLNESRIAELGVEPIRGMLATIERIASKADLARSLAELAPFGVSGPFQCGVGADAKKSDQHILHLSQPSLGLPDRDYYWDARCRKKLAAYGEHVERMLSLAGVSNAKQAAADVVALETRLAKAQWSKVDNRNRIKTYNKNTLAELAELAPGFDWNLYFDSLGVDRAKDLKELIVAQPSYFAALSGMMDSVPPAVWRTWLQWRVVHQYASLLHQELVDADFAFYGRTLRGIPANRPRWKRAIAAVNGCLGEAVGKLYVEKYFPPEAKARVDRMVGNVLKAYAQAFQNNEWLSLQTKQKALAKLAAIGTKIGYADKWRDYSSLHIDRNDLVGNMQRAAAFEWRRQLAKLGKPVDRGEWLMTPQTVNAYYNPNVNEIVFPAAILQPPFFNLAADDAVNYGGIGTVIGHEIGHGFDDQGSKQDGAGNLVDWWTLADRAEFDKRGAALAAQFDRFEPFPGFNVNGRFTLGENIGDLSGLTISLAAYHLSLGDRKAAVIDGLTGDQRFFMGFAQVWRHKYRDDELKNKLLTDPHSPAEYRVNGTVRNVPGFYSAFGVKDDDKMYLPPEQRVKIW